MKTAITAAVCVALGASALSVGFYDTKYRARSSQLVQAHNELDTLAEKLTDEQTQLNHIRNKFRSCEQLQGSRYELPARLYIHSKEGLEPIFADQIDNFDRNIAAEFARVLDMASTIDATIEDHFSSRDIMPSVVDSYDVSRIRSRATFIYTAVVDDNLYKNLMQASCTKE